MGEFYRLRDEDVEEKPKRRHGDHIPPKLHFVHFDDDTFTLKPKETLKIEIPYDGNPVPSIQILKDGRPLVPSQHVQTDDSDFTVRLTVWEVTAADTGIYSIIAENIAGIDTVEIVVVVRGLPDAPRNLKASDVTPETCLLKWEAPVDDGGSPISRYVIERRGFGRKTWQRIGAARETHFEAENLLEDQSYEFRVVAENVNGEGEGAELEGAVVAKYTFGECGMIYCCSQLPAAASRR